MHEKGYHCEGATLIKRDGKRGEKEKVCSQALIQNERAWLTYFESHAALKKRGGKWTVKQKSVEMKSGLWLRDWMIIKTSN